MKKLLIGLGVLGVFIVYSLWVRHEQPTIAPPSALASSGNTNTSGGTSSKSGAASGSGTPNGSSGDGSSSNRGSTVSGQYKDGTYTGSVADAYYGNVQVSATISGGKLSNVTFLQYPDTHPDSIMINRQAMPYLQQEAIQAQSTQVQIVSGATFTSQAFVQSLEAALAQAKA